MFNAADQNLTNSLKPRTRLKNIGETVVTTRGFTWRTFAVTRERQGRIRRSFGRESTISCDLESMNVGGLDVRR
jgi:hypothetical protein